MKKTLIALLLLALVIGGVLVWLAASVGPETAPQEMKSIELDSDYDR